MKQYKEALVDFESGKEQLKNESDAKQKMFDDWISKCKEKLPKEVIQPNDAPVVEDNTISIKPTAQPTIK